MPRPVSDGKVRVERDGERPSPAWRESGRQMGRQEALDVTAEIINEIVASQEP